MHINIIFHWRTLFHLLSLDWEELLLVSPFTLELRLGLNFPIAWISDVE